MNPEDNWYMDFNSHWEGKDEDFDYCDCPGPPSPPQFVIPPPPPPPSLQLCQGEHTDLQYCKVRALGSDNTHPHFYFLPVIAVVSSVVVVISVASFLLWKHKKKIQNFLPCKSGHQTRCDVDNSNGVTYNDVLMNHHPVRLSNNRGLEAQTLTPIELLDVKFARYKYPHLVPVSHKKILFTSEKGRSMHSDKGKDLFSPVYEEICGASDGKDGSHSSNSDIDDSEVDARIVASEDEFAEDELSLGEYPHQPSRPYSVTSSFLGHTRGDLCPKMSSAPSDGAECTENKTLQRLFQENSQGRSSCRKHSSHSLERNKDGHPSEGFEAKENYYNSKNMLGSELSYSNIPHEDEKCLCLFPNQIVGHHNKSFLSGQCLPQNICNGERVPVLYFPELRLPARSLSPPLLLYPAEIETEPLPSVYDPHAAFLVTTSKSSCLPGGLLSESDGRADEEMQLVSHLEYSPDDLSGPMFTVESEDANITAHGHVNQGNTDSLELHTSHTLGGRRPPAPPMRGNISSVKGERLFTIDENHHHHKLASNVPSDTCQSFYNTEKLIAPNNTKTYHNIPVTENLEENGPCGDIRSVSDSRTLYT
ncbi:uncharacterized protein LOC143222942 [Tachypleus tridentatus]|uniref:uncharacterized protein LOC143222942 n=1 Tax=Tachypleus tridentatus TaxID=6853 RepID=UPI003FCFD476